MKKYLSLIGIAALILIICRLGYQAFFAYLAGHTYYISMLSSGQNRWIFISALICTLFPIGYLFISSKIKVRKLIMWFMIGAGIFGLVHSNIKGDPIGFGHIITIFNTILLVCLGIYLIIGFSALGSWIERKIIKFKQFCWQEIFLSSGIGFCSFVVIVQILLGIGILYGIVSRLLFLGLGFMIRYERKQLGKWGKIFGNLLDNYKNGVLSGEKFGKKIGFIITLLLLIISLVYLYIGIQNSFVPYPTAWDANHEYIYFPKILAENAGIYRGNSIGNKMPGIWSSFITFVFSLTGCTNGRFGLSADNIAISMNNLSSFFVLILGIAVIFQVLIVFNNKECINFESKSNDNKNGLNTSNFFIKNHNGIIIGRTVLLLRLTSGMGAFLVIVDNKSDLGVMSLCLLALFAGLSFLSGSIDRPEKKQDYLKYVILIGLFFGFAVITKVTAMVDFVLYGLLLIGLWYSPLLSLGLGITTMGILKKMHVFTSDAILSDTNAIRLITIGFIISGIAIIIHLLKPYNRKNFLGKCYLLGVLGGSFLITLLLFKFSRSTISLIKLNNYSFSESLKSTFLTIDTTNVKKNDNNFLSLNSGDIDLDTYEENNSYNSLNINDSFSETLRNDLTYKQCISAGDIYSDDELYENLWDLSAIMANEDLGRYIGYGWKSFKQTDIIKYEANEVSNQKIFNLFKLFWPKINGVNGMDSSITSQTSGLGINKNNVIFSSNLLYGLLKKIWPTSQNCYGFNHDAKVLCNNADAIDNFKIDKVKTIYETGINNKKGEAGLLLEDAITAYNKAKSEGKIGNGEQNSDLFHDEIVKIRQYYQSHSIYSDENSINIPYRYLVPLNIVFNWTIQNLSSYYTDIGYFWVIIYILLLLALPYSILKKDKLLISITLTTLIGWCFWWIIGSSILRYGTALISWTMISLIIFWNNFLQKKINLRLIPYFLAVIVGISFGIQMIFNLLRISSQGANSTFVWYKGNIGLNQILDNNLEYKYKTKYGYNWKDVFDLQFPQYNPIITSLENRKDDDGAIVAGTYLQYFLKNQWNVDYDGLLTHIFWTKISDGDLCKTYRRFKKGNVRYIIIDPNLGSVSSGEGNETLFYRFFGKLNEDETKSEIDGTIITLIRLYKNGYLKLISTNNLGAKYAFTVDDTNLKKLFGEDLNSEDLILIRSKMAVLQYFSDAQLLFNAVEDIFINRMLNNGKGCIEDIANMYGLEINSSKVFNIAQKHLNRIQINNDDIKGLNQNERSILIAYLNIRYLYQQDQNNFKNTIQDLLLNSVSGPSQIISVGLYE